PVVSVMPTMYLCQSASFMMSTTPERYERGTFANTAGQVSYFPNSSGDSVATREDGTLWFAMPSGWPVPVPEMMAASSALTIASAMLSATVASNTGSATVPATSSTATRTCNL